MFSFVQNQNNKNQVNECVGSPLVLMLDIVLVRDSLILLPLCWKASVGDKQTLGTHLVWPGDRLSSVRN